MMRRFHTLAALFIATLLALPAQSFAVGSGGFENASFSAKQYGRGYAVTAVPEDDPASISYNPAGINDLKGVQIQSNMHFINMWTNMRSDQPGAGSSRSSGTTVPVPTIYISANPGTRLGLNNRLAFGLGVDSPFGLANKYNAGFTADHYTGFRNWIKMYAIKPVASFRLADWLSIGGGPIWYRAFDVGQIASYPNAALAAGPPLGLVGATTPDGQIRANMSGNAWGWQMGLLVKPAPKHRLGFYFRSPALLRLKGLAKGENIANVPFGTGASGKFETGVHTKMNLPLNMSWGYNYKINEKTDIGADFGFTRWSSFDNLNVIADPIAGTTLGGLSTAHDSLINSLFNTPGSGGAADKDWHNAYSLMVGGAHKLNKKLTLRSGALLYITPVPKHSFTPAIPDANRFAFSLGIGYKIIDNLDLDLAYMPIFFMNRHVKNDISDALSTSVDGKYSSFLHVWTAGITYKFDSPQPKTEDWEGSTVK